MGTYSESKICTRCKVSKSITLFSRKRGTSVRHTVCKQCKAKIYQRNRYKTTERIYDDTKKLQLKQSYLKRKYNLTLQEYDEIFISRNNSCDICGSNVSGRNAHIDHSHSTGKVRGLLCSCCNTGLGQFKDNPISLQNAITYLMCNGN